MRISQASLNLVQALGIVVIVSYIFLASLLGTRGYYMNRGHSSLIQLQQSSTFNINTETDTHHTEPESTFKTDTDVDNSQSTSENFQSTPENYETYIKKFRDSTPQCIWPFLSLSHPSISKWTSKPAAIKCAEKRLSFFKLATDGRLIVVAKFGLLDEYDCRYRSIGGVLAPDHKELVFGEPTNITENVTVIHEKIFEVQCFRLLRPTENVTIEGRPLRYEREYAQILPEHVQDHAESSEDNLSIDILVLDSVSTNQFMRQTPLLYDYVFKQPNWVMFDKAAKVADNTLGNMVALMAGQKLLEPNYVTSDNWTSEFDTSDGKKVDFNHDIDFIWKYFQKKNCSTMFNIDPIFKAYGFGYYPAKYMSGFTKWPVDYYLRPFYFYLIRTFPSVFYRADALCRHDIPDHEVVLRLLRQWISVTKDKCHFSATQALHAYTHEKINLFNHLEQPLLRFLKSKATEQRLNHTVLLMMGDHGHRLSAIKYTPLGQIEERQSFFAFRFPKWYPSAHPQKWAQIQANKHHLMTHWDVHETLHDIIGTEPNDRKAPPPTDRGRSLLSQSINDESRNCETLDIPPQFCLCLEPFNTTISDRSDPETSFPPPKQMKIDRLNVFLAEYLECDSMKSVNILDAQELEPNQWVRYSVRHFDNDTLTKIAKGPPPSIIVYYRFSALLDKRIYVEGLAQHFLAEYDDWHITCLRMVPERSGNNDTATGSKLETCSEARLREMDKLQLHC